MFLEENKVWLRNQLTLDSVSAEELTKREKYFTKLKNDNYYWCFPNESESSSIHKVIDFLHEKVKNALEIVRREEMNKSLQTLFKEMNDNTTNLFEFGKQFMAYLLYFSKKVGSNLTAAKVFDGNSIENGKLHFLLEKTTRIVFDSYMKDMELTYNRTHDRQMPTLANQNESDYKSIQNSQNNIADAKGGAENSSTALVRTSYDIAIRGYETALMGSTVYIVKIIDPKNHQWVAKRSWSEFESLHNSILKEMVTFPDFELKLVFPQKKSNFGALFTNSNQYNEFLAKELDAYCLQLMGVICDLNNKAQAILAKFIETKYLMVISQNEALRYAESIPNAFVPIKAQFQTQLLGSSPGSSSNQAESKSGYDENFTQKELDEFRKVWGVEYCLKIMEAYAILQRIATVLGWTLEINQFFISMFGNTVTFSRLPLKDIISTLKELISLFVGNASELYRFACQLNADAKYKWHKNLQMTENELTRVKFHAERAIATINIIEVDHLDYEAQMRRLKDVYARFQPFMNRVGPSLVGIKTELGLPAPQYTFSEFAAIEDKPQAADGKNPKLLITHGMVKDTEDEDTNYDESRSKNNPTAAIFSRTHSETSIPATEHNNPVLELDGGSSNNTGMLPTAEESAAQHSNKYPVSPSVIRNEESSAVCIVS